MAKQKDTQWTDSTRYGVLILLLLAVVGLVIWARPAAGPLVIGSLIAYLLNPLVEWLMRVAKITRRVSVNIVFILLLIIFTAIPVSFIPALLNELASLTADFQDVLDYVDGLLSQSFEVGGFAIDLGALLPDITESLSLDLTAITNQAFHYVEVITENFLWLLVILATIYFLLKDWFSLREWLIGLFPADYQSDVRFIHEEIKKVWRGYLRGNLILMLIVGIVFSITWAAIGVPSALLLGTITGLFTIVPDVGPAAAVGIAILVALFEGSTFLPISNFWFAILVFAIYMVLINLKNIWLRPKLFGLSVHMHEGLVFIIIMLAILLGGILHAIIVVPLVASLGIIGRYLLNRAYGQEPFPQKNPVK